MLAWVTIGSGNGAGGRRGWPVQRRACRNLAAHSGLEIENERFHTPLIRIPLGRKVRNLYHRLFRADGLPIAGTSEHIPQPVRQDSFPTIPAYSRDLATCARLDCLDLAWAKKSVLVPSWEFAKSSRCEVSGRLGYVDGEFRQAATLGHWLAWVLPLHQMGRRMGLNLHLEKDLRWG